MPNQIINTIGLLFSILGVVVLFFYGPPQPTFEEGIGFDLEDANVLEDGKTVADHNDEVRMLKKRYKIMSRIALILIFVGFILQLCATWII